MTTPDDLAAAGGWTPEIERASPAPDGPTLQAVAQAVRAGLCRTRKSLPAWLLYDRRGSELFERITTLPEYYLTRTERAILTAHAGAMIDAAGPPLSVVELGAGTATKTGLLLSALLARQARVRYRPVDVSPSALARAARELGRVQRLTVEPIVARYPEELGFLSGLAGRRLLLFLGSNIGNFEPTRARALLAALRRRLVPGDALLIGADLRKPASVLLPAYDDAAGVTAEFSKNVLVRLNRELGADFDLQRFRHLVRWNATASRIEIFLQSERAQRVTVRALDHQIAFRAGERIHTESSYKLSRERLFRLFRAAGLRPEQSWYDPRRRFGVHLFRVPPRRARASLH
ncbi:MAG TPA: L-histidine N(alpha)-methyltransferase [Polyangia bacterium]|nr:L-histidine N(alpha)-methyltransferase [Polyangia bacterium]